MNNIFFLSESLEMALLFFVSPSSFVKNITDYCSCDFISQPPPPTHKIFAKATVSI